MKRVIVIAAGLGSRLKETGEVLPKCMLEVGDKTILQHQIDAYRANAVTDISIVTGYKRHLVNPEGVRKFENTDYQNNNILKSLLYAREAMQEGFIASYSDIVFRDNVVKALLDSKADIAVAVDKDWKPKYVGRTEHPIEEAEKAILDKENRLIEIGKHLESTSGEQADSEFIGMLKCTQNGAKLFLEYFDRAEKEFTGKPFIRAAIFEKAYITDLLQYMLNCGVEIQGVPVDGFWCEIDTQQDLDRACEAFRGIKNG